MRKKTRAKRALSHACHQWSGFVFAEPATRLLPQVRSRLKSHQIIMDDNEILVIESGFVTMALYSDRAIAHEEAIVVPGVDCCGQRGFLVLREGVAPFHSLSCSAIDACHESALANKKANALLAAFGDKNNLRKAVRNVPWYTMVTEQDREDSGLCAWGSESFLRKYRLQYIAKRFGLPQIILRLAGSYGDRLVAASLLRTKLHNTSQILNSGSR